MKETSRLCLNLHKVRIRMRELHLTKSELGNMIGMKDLHTVSYYFKNPDRIRLNHVTAIAEALGSTPYQYEEFVLRVRDEEEYQKLIHGED